MPTSLEILFSSIFRNLKKKSGNGQYTRNI